MLMSTCGACIVRQNQQESVRSCVYKEIAANHYLLRGSVDTHTRWGHDGGANQGLSITETWDTVHWKNCVFAFIIAITEVNAYLTIAQFHGNQEDFEIFERKLAQELIHNELDQDITQKHTRARSNKHKYIKHSLHSVPLYLKFINGKWKKSTEENTSKNFVQLRMHNENTVTILVFSRNLLM